MTDIVATPGRRLTYGLILALALQGGGLLIWGATLSAQVSENSRNLATNSRLDEEQRKDVNAIAKVLAGVEATLDTLVAQVTRIANRLDSSAAERGGTGAQR